MTLRIKRKFLSKIASGEKKVEYRSYTNFYKKLIIKAFKNGDKTLTLHYQKGLKLTVPILSIKIEKNNLGSPLVVGSKLIAIYLDN